MKFLQSGPLVHRAAQVECGDVIMTEHQLSQVYTDPQSWTQKNTNAVLSHVQRTQTNRQRDVLKESYNTI